MEPRQEKAIDIAAKSRLTRQGGVWLVPSRIIIQYTVDPDPQAPSCSCPDFEARNNPPTAVGGIQFHTISLHIERTWIIRQLPLAGF